jgi:hypothetical protein
MLKAHPELIHESIERKITSSENLSIVRDTAFEFALNRINSGGDNGIAVAKAMATLFPNLLTDTDAKGRTILHRFELEAPHAVAQIEALCAMGANVNAADETGATPLHYAATCGLGGAETHTRALLKHGAQADARDRNGLTPLMYSAQNSDASCHVTVLLGTGAGIGAEDNNGITATMHAIRAEAQQMAVNLLRYGGEADFRDPATAAFRATLDDDEEDVQRIMNRQEAAFNRKQAEKMEAAISAMGRGLDHAISVRKICLRKAAPGKGTP